MFDDIEPIRDLTFVRRLQAPCTAVFRAWTDPAALARWWGPSRFRNTVCEIDARPGGSLRIHMTAPDGAVFPCGGVVRKVRPPEFIAFTTTVGFGGETLLEALNILRLEAEGAGTRLTLATRILHAAPIALSEHLSGIAQLWGESLDGLTYLMETGR